MGSLNKLLELENLQKLIEDIQKMANQFCNKRADKKIIRKELYNAINKKYKIDLPIKNYKPDDDRYWLSKEHHEQMATKLAKIVHKKKEQDLKEDSEKNITKIVFDTSKKEHQKTTKKEVSKLLNDIEKNLGIDKKKT